MAEVGSSYPGGPRRSNDGAERTSRTPLSSEERLERGRSRHRRRKDRRRRIYATAVIGVAVFAAATLGYVLGDRVSADGREGTAEGRDALSAEELVTSELNRVLMELWKMESLEQR